MSFASCVFRSWETCGGWFVWMSQRTVWRSFLQSWAAFWLSPTCCSLKTCLKSFQTVSVRNACWERSRIKRTLYKSYLTHWVGWKESSPLELSLLFKTVASVKITSALVCNVEVLSCKGKRFHSFIFRVYIFPPKYVWNLISMKCWSRKHWSKLLVPKSASAKQKWCCHLLDEYN